MPDYEILYRKMFNAATDAERLLGYALESAKYHSFDNMDSGETSTIIATAQNDLQAAQIECEELYMQEPL